MSEILVTTLNTPGGPVKIHVREDGWFLAEVEGEVVTASSLAGLKEKLGKALTETPIRVEVPVCKFEYDKFVDGVATGRHATTRNVLVRWNGRKGTEQLRSYELQLMPALSAEEKAEFLKLLAAYRAAQKAVSAFETARKVNVGTLVDAAIEKVKAGS